MVIYAWLFLSQAKIFGTPGNPSTPPPPTQIAPGTELHVGIAHTVFHELESTTKILLCSGDSRPDLLGAKPIVL